MGTKTARDAAYLAFVRELPCVVTRSPVDVVAHHVRVKTGGGMALKPSDYFTVPLTPLTHARLHHEGEAAFWRRHNTDPFNWITWTMARYATVKGGIHLPYPNGGDLTAEELAVFWESLLAER